MFSYKNWTLTSGNIVGLTGMFSAISLVLLDSVSWYWLLPWPFIHLFNAVIISAGLHRYFSHGSYKVSTFWHKFIAFYSITLQYGSPYAWAVSHTTHHVHSDGPGDPHFVKPSYIITKKYNRVPMVMTRFKKLLGDPTLDFVHRHWISGWLIWCVLLLAISPLVFLYLYLLPMGSAHLAGAIHQVISHRGGSPRNLSFLEVICPTGGEWLHSTHHAYPGRTSFRANKWDLDLGSIFISLIKSKA